MKKAIYIFSFGLLVTFYSCNSKQENNDTQANTSATDAVTEIPEPTSPTSLEQTLAQPAPQPSPAPAGQEVALNPEHGKPGHRCEIPVGAPLNSVPTTTNAHVEASPAPQPAINTQIPDLGPVNPALRNSLQGLNNTGKINPPHGQPGHDCAVPVGAPLPAK